MSGFTDVNKPFDVFLIKGRHLSHLDSKCVWRPVLGFIVHVWRVAAVDFQQAV